jgi:iron complex transport system ATP-binding protein
VSIEVRSLVHSNRNFTLRLEGLEFAGGRLTCIVGPNGAGKTTLLKCLAAIHPLERRSVFLEGKDLAGMSASDRARRIAYVPQEHVPTFSYTVRDFVLTGRAAHLPLFALPAARDEAAAEEALDFVGLLPFADRPYAQLSSGERRLVLIARALAQNAGTLLLDEPTTFLDPKHEVEVLDFIRRLTVERGITVLVTLHNLEMAIKYSDALVFLKKGTVRAAGPPQEVLSEPLLRDVYDIPMRIVRCDGHKLIIR